LFNGSTFEKAQLVQVPYTIK